MSTVLEERTIIRPAVIPYYKERDQFPPDLLRQLYRKMCAQGLDREVWHDRAMTEDEVVQYLDKDVLTSIWLDIASGQYVGFSYASNIEHTDTLQKCLVSVCVFKEYQDRRLTIPFGQIYLSQLFNVLGMTTVCQVTPEPNRMARLYCAQLGFKQVATIPQFLSYHGETVDAILGLMTRDEFNSKE